MSEFVHLGINANLLRENNQLKAENTEILAEAIANFEKDGVNLPL